MRQADMYTWPWPFVSMDPTSLDSNPQIGGPAVLAILCKGLKHPWISVSAGVLEPIPCGYQGTTVLTLGWRPISQGNLSYAV